MLRKLNKRNNLYKYVYGMVETGLEMYYDSNTLAVSIYYVTLKNGLTYMQLKYKIQEYITRNNLVGVYRYVTIIGG